MTTGRYILKGAAIGSLFAISIGVLLALGPTLVKKAELLEAKALTYELLGSIIEQLPGQYREEKWSVSEGVFHLLAQDHHVHGFDQMTGEAKQEGAHHFGTARGYAIFDSYGTEIGLGGQRLVGGSNQIQLTGGLEAVMLSGKHSMRALTSGGGATVYRNFVPLYSGGKVTAVAVVDIESNGVQELVVHSVKTAAIAAATLVGLVFAIVLILLMRAGTNMRRAEQRASYLANFDSLTGLHNRRSLDAEVLKLADGAQFCLFIADIEGFKKINDRHGHLVGDIVIRRVARIMQQHFGETILARWTGDQFVGLVTGPVELQECAQDFARLHDAVGQPLKIGNIEIACSLNTGSTAGSWNAGSLDTFLGQADVALLAAKREPGKSVHVAHSTSLEIEQVRDRKIAERLDIAIAKSNFSLAYQPQYDAVAKKLRGFEVLIRWQDSYLGNVSPALFIPIAERSDQIVQIGDWVLSEACKAAAQWPVACQISVNISAHQIARPDFVTKVRAALETSGLAPSRLELEITETALLALDKQVLGRLNEVAQMGVGLALDDFGTGHSTLTYLATLPLTKLKIDRSFVNQVGDAGPNDAIITAVVGLAKSLKLNVIAEGVETPEQSARITGMGCSDIQGYLYGKPTFEPFGPASRWHDRASSRVATMDRQCA